LVGWSKDREGVVGDIAGADVRGAVDIVIDIVIADIIDMLFLSKFGVITLLLLFLMLEMFLFFNYLNLNDNIWNKSIVLRNIN
jgi:hypothetical protein